MRALTWTGTSVCHLMQNMYYKYKCEFKLVHVSYRTLMQMVNVTRELTLYSSIKVFNWNRASYKYRPQRGNISCSISVSDPSLQMPSCCNCNYHLSQVLLIRHHHYGRRRRGQLRRLLRHVRRQRDPSRRTLVQI